MWEEFDLEVEEGKLWLRAYLWPVKAPEQVAVIVHGIGEYAGRYDRVAGILNEANIAVLSMDLRGHGKSPGKRGHGAPRNKVLRDVDCLIVEAEKRYMGVPVILYGHSMGANMVLDYRVRGILANRPVAYLVDLLPEEYLSTEELNQGFSGSVLDLLLMHEGHRLTESKTDIRAVSASAEIARALQMQRGDVLLLFIAQLFAGDGSIIDYSYSYFLPGYFRFHVVRRISTSH